ncbi:hypothetical protein HRJ35_03300 [Shewanella oneidensis MR-1]|uniref:Uncharacterized protein n=1 Tax=Shewanella oneidensis (strain ATCC 700550 / JCM 31522 / CIP 106686 / LMG 19005 / NCIMB 14063 / MR-1) TaxID=211586 RepID=Q8EKE6_SHEON|nr:hypothetical protein [Shewanella oneidensis]AAN53236.1 uncharacterized protein SO_0149 [Shewanella oneidensis MR-1]MDX5997875.1 hypothetical protein [Shewanella oneidensis]MEE2027846.1 hypothetical protein [Shewanella oneidensis]QKG94548.1 hypothetical protein HRJ35_03300 [Shewanella oneidensis MR-1]
MLLKKFNSGCLDKLTNNQGPIDSEQPSLMNDDLQLLKQNCSEEFKGMK